MKPASFGYTVQVPGFGFLRDVFPDPYIAKWTIKDGFAESADLSGVRIPDCSFVGGIGVAPSRALRGTIQRREASLLDRGGMGLPPEPRGRHQRVRGRDIKREERLAGDDRPVDGARLEPTAGLRHL